MKMGFDTRPLVGSGGGGSTPEFVLGWAGNDPVTDNSVEYTPFFNFETNAWSGFESLGRWIAPMDMILKDISVWVDGNTGNTNDIDIDVMVASAASALGCTVTVNTLGKFQNAVEQSVIVSRGDYLGLRATNTGNFGSFNMRGCGVRCQLA